MLVETGRPLLLFEAQDVRRAFEDMLASERCCPSAGPPLVHMSHVSGFHEPGCFTMSADTESLSRARAREPLSVGVCPKGTTLDDVEERRRCEKAVSCSQGPQRMLLYSRAGETSDPP